MSYIDQLGTLGFGSRLKRVSERIMASAILVYKNLGINFEAHWFPVFHLLSKTGKPMSVTEIAHLMKYSHPAVIKITNAMIKANLLKSKDSTQDSRKRLLTVTYKGKILFQELEPIWERFYNITQELFEEIDTDMISLLDKLEAALDKKEIHQRFKELVKSQDSIIIRDYQSIYQNSFRQLNNEWLEKYFQIEEGDAQILSNPQSEIIDKGGFILFAEYKGQIVGTVALEKVDDKTYMLSKMAVTEKYQGRKIGHRLANAVIEKAREMEAHKIVLTSDLKLEKAMALYKKLGFTISVTENHDLGRYARAKSGIYMEMSL